MFGFFVKFQPEFLTVKGAEILLEFFNVMLIALGSNYRFPKKLVTFKVHGKVDLFLLKDVEEYLVCLGCHNHYLWKKGTYMVSAHPPVYCAECKDILLFKNEARTISVRSFYYRSIIGAIQDMFFRPGFDRMLQIQQQRVGLADYFSDIYDGEVWKTFKVADDQPVFTQESHRNLMLYLNCDWLQPLDNKSHSTGAIYITVQNIPREYRMLMSNCILVAIIAGPEEPNKDVIRHYFRRLTDELLQFMHGVEMEVLGKGKQLVKAALTQLASDIPATKKVIGMAGHSAGQACHRCANNFRDGPVYLTEYSLENCTKRDMVTHRANAKKWLEEPMITKRDALVKQTGCRSSPLLDIPYIDVHRFSVHDPMHGFFLVSGLFSKSII
jgi:hypothetical protein